MSIEAMKQALEALEILARYENPETRIQVRKPKDGGPIVTMYPHKVALDAAQSLRQAIEQAEKQEPVAWMTINAYGEEDDIHYENPEGHLPEGWTYKPLYTHPPQARQTQDEPLGYWNAVEGWVELPEEDNKPAAWVEPEFWEHLERVNCGTAYRLPEEGRQPLYTAPQPQREWVGLTDEEIDKTHETQVWDARRSYARAIEQASKEKNT